MILASATTRLWRLCLMSTSMRRRRRKATTRMVRRVRRVVRRWMPSTSWTKGMEML